MNNRTTYLDEYPCELILKIASYLGLLNEKSQFALLKNSKNVVANYPCLKNIPPEVETLNDYENHLYNKRFGSSISYKENNLIMATFAIASFGIVKVAFYAHPVLGAATGAGIFFAIHKSEEYKKEKQQNIKIKSKEDHEQLQNLNLTMKINPLHT